ncbi:MAG: GxxExxY protein [Saprospiraceae bacterium]|jgi:GxxExxY protein|uniref:GxxExxY protein n=1 Tax=Candidatus Defluviibacterium haderslevense TaxID=2981993 RepID=A0A9D7XFH0_9BACT|nr:GxxExxY protein [Candidatus Defluviibacterium haderslevense]MCC7027588.1 GxxExxY protein [Saprospiraceae bacterium]MBK7245904.1 GxxExxY protein [Candidatus Defluviibacterium haderslevense]MBK8244044.1 GxxExxY protein [Candidatus Defluviibacterium haderslevense]MBK9718661.1 GxxExxY protein [Candidatus Defluviibacterium haderslevense]
MTENEISYAIIGIAIELHSKLGPGLLESVYEHTLAYELRKFGFFVEQQVPIPLIYEDVRLDCGYRLDLRVERKVIIEIKAVDYMPGVHYAQVLTYLKLCNCKLGLLMNFNTVKLKEGIHRMVNGL